MNSPEELLTSFSDYLQSLAGAGRVLYQYAGYKGSGGSLLLKIRPSGSRVLVRPWRRHRPVGMTNIQRSNARYKTFRGQDPDIHVHLASSFRQNAIRYARSSDSSALIGYDLNARTVRVAASSNLPGEFLDAFLEFCSKNELSVEYDFTGTLSHKGFKDDIAQADRVATRPRNPRLFLSYSWDSEKHRRWVLKLSSDLIRNGVKVYIDEWDLENYHNDLHLFMESGIREADYVVLVCTPGYKNRADIRKGGVGVESTIITGEFFDPSNAHKFIPVLRSAEKGHQSCLPSYLKSRYAIDFTIDSEYQSKLEELLRRVFRQPRYRKPDLGPIPKFGSEDV